MNKISLSDYRGSRNRDEMKDEIRQMLEPLSPNSEELIDRVLITHFPETKFVLLVGSVPEQGEDIYWILIDNRRIAVLEVPRLPGAEVSDVLVEVMSIEQRWRYLGNKFHIAVKAMRDALELPEGVPEA